MSEVTVETVCYFLDVNEKLLLKWNKKGYLPRTGVGYKVADLDVFLTNFVRQGSVTWHDLVAQRDVLVSSVNVKRIFGLEAWQVSPVVRSNPIAYAVFPDRMGHYSLADFRRVVSQFEPVVDGTLAARVMGYKNAVDARTAPGIELAPSLVQPKKLCITEASLRSYLGRHLPQWVSVDGWLDDCWVADESLVPMREVAKILTIPRRTTRVALAERQARYIERRSVNGGSSLFVLSSWVQSQIEKDAPLTNAQSARLIGVTVQAADYWWRSGLSICPIAFHNHAQGDVLLWRSCWVAYLRNNCAHELTPTIEWFVHRRLVTSEPPELMSVGRLSERSGCDPEMLRSLAATGKLSYIRTPGGEYRFTVEWAKQAGLTLVQ